MKISNNCYIVSGLSVEPPWAVNSGFIVGEHTTLIVDTGSNYLSAQTIYGYALCAAPQNKLVVINTEPHFDHIGGNCFFYEKGVEIFAHPQIYRSEADFQQNIVEFNNTIPNEVRRKNNESNIFFYKTKLVNPNRSLTGIKTIDIGGLIISIHEMPGHTPFNITLFEPEERVLFCGDTMVTGYLPNLENSNKTLWKSWLKALNDIFVLSPEIIIPGHGYSIVGIDNIRNEIDKMKSIIETAIRYNKAPTA
ncbi:MBL fold metallo-hydrolase [Desulfopila aestuarii]|uniref:Glyoxylase, beta-lactamase superfamily II n=1 Tax=Desulfopila aestuarii DSM 18488 TaxID=1121416 RepID=A0A1M7XY45_9BACT|nr:MBL fold metallo-hydrolase [Desulfopila aestuarii]SHO43712.1 Glyoxylase, beta-lactamase superfamily II [Desulfopila aestuarii DSM 18488]